MANNIPADQLRVKYGFWVVIIGMFVIVLVFLSAIARWTTEAGERA